MLMTMLMMMLMTMMLMMTIMLMMMIMNIPQDKWRTLLGDIVINVGDSK